MANIGGFGTATSAGLYRLVFGGIDIGTWIESYISTWKRITPVNKRHNFWSDNVLLDGHYPAIVWKHDFLVYHEAASRLAYLDDWVDLVDLVSNAASALYIKDGDTSDNLVAFSNCFIETTTPDNPDNLLLYKAGMFRVTFVGNTKPVVTT